jgi:hypothetical protein
MRLSLKDRCGWSRKVEHRKLFFSEFRTRIHLAFELTLCTDSILSWKKGTILEEYQFGAYKRGNFRRY